MPRPADTASPRPLVALWCLLLGLVLARALGPLSPTMWAWSLEAPRFLPPVAAWLPTVLGAVFLVPALARPAARALLRAGGPLAGRTAPAAALAGLGAAALVWSLPDRLCFVGDCLLRRGVLNVAGDPRHLFPQATPLELLLHVTLPRLMMQSWGLDAALAARLGGAVDAALLGILAVLFVRAARFSGAAALAAGVIVFGGGYLTGMTGCGKVFPDLAVLAVAAGVCALREDEDGRDLAGLAACAVLGLALHRSALVLLPSLAWAWFERLRHDGPAAWRRPWVRLALALTALALGFVPGLVALLASRRDALHLALPEVARTGLLRATFGGARAADLASLLALVSPLAVAIPALLLAGGRRLALTRPTRMLCALALPMFATALLVHPAQGMFRDWDVYFMAGAGLSALAAWLVGRTLQDRPRAAWLALATGLAVAGPTLQWLLLNADLERGLAHTRALVLEPPARSAAERAATWSFLGQRDFERGDFARAAQDYEQAVAAAPSPRLLTEWGLARQRLGDFAGARELYSRALRTDPRFVGGWMGLGACAIRLGDAAGAARALHELERLDPGNPETAELVPFLRRRPAPAADRRAPSGG